MTSTYADIKEAAEYEEARREHNVCALGNGEDPAPYGVCAVCGEELKPTEWNSQSYGDKSVDVPVGFSCGCRAKREAERMYNSNVHIDDALGKFVGVDLNGIEYFGKTVQTCRDRISAANAAIARHAVANARAEAPPQEPRKPLPAQLSKVARAQGRAGRTPEEQKLAAITKMLNDTAGKRKNLYTGGEHRVKWL